MARQMIRFNYFEPMLVIENDELAIWNMQEFFEFIIANRRAFNPAVFLGDEVADLEWNSCGYDETNRLYYMQLSKLRSKNIPARKRINQDKEPLELTDDEYLGEFNLLIYDPLNRVLITQGNFYGLTTKQITLTLSGIRAKYMDYISRSDGDTPYIVYLSPIPDVDAIERVRGNQIYRKITIKGSDYQEIARERLNSQVLSHSIDALESINGVNFEITVTMANAPKQEGLDNEEVRNMINDILILQANDETDVSMHIASRRDEENSMEYINLLKPRITSTIILEVANRSTIGFEYIFNGFKEQNYFNEELAIQSKIISTLSR